MYNSPISIFEPAQTIYEQISKATEEYVYKAVLSQNIDVNRDELIKALRYDRDQYNKGYHDAMLKLNREWISAKDRLPEYHVPVLAVVADKILSSYVYVAQRIEDGFWSYQNGYCGFWICPNEKIAWWMPLPEPPKEDVNE